VAALIEKFDLSEQRLGRLDDVERGIGDLLAQVVELRAQNERSLQAIKHELVTSAAQAVSTPAEAIRRDVASLKDIQTSLDRRTNDTFEAVYGTLEQMVDRLATLEQGYRQAANAAPPVMPLRATEAPSIEPTSNAPMAEAAPVRHDPAQRPASGSARQAAPSAQARAPLNSELAPDAPLEPGSGLRRARVVANAVDRIAASEAANTAIATAKPAETAPPARSSFVAAARRAAQTVASSQPESKSNKAAAEVKEPTAGPSLMQRLGPRIKSVIVGISVVMLVLGALRIALDLFYNGEPSGPSAVQEPVRAPARSDDALPPMPSAPEAPAPAAPATPAPSVAPPLPAPSVTPAPDPPRTGRGASLEQSAPPEPRAVAALPGNLPFGQVPISGSPSDFVAAPLPVAPAATGSLPARSLSAPEQSVPVLDLARNPLPATIGSKALVNAAANGDLGASFEIGLRYAEGRNVPQDLALAAAWFDRGARSGMALAQFRLGSMYEKGVGVKKDLTEARRLYLAASDKGNAKAMHNLAVLYAEGADGKPDYAVAAQWFQKAAAYGVVDSQYNLAILYARGLGVERSMAESYKWFALAAKGGDKDAGAKRDEVGARLDPVQVDSARKAVDAFVAEPQPDEAVATKAPAGGWDQVAAATPSKPKSR
jgi:localization factor PodJL